MLDVKLLRWPKVASRWTIQELVSSSTSVDGEVVNPDQVPLGVASEEDQVPFRAEKLDELVLAVGVVDEEETGESGDGSVTGCAVLGLKGVLPGVVFSDFVRHC